jgi:MFS family permease
MSTLLTTSLSIFGRVIPGALADKFGRFNMQTLMSFFAAIVVLALALPASTNAAYIVFAVLYGFASGAYVALIPVQIAYIAPMEKIGVYTGVCFTAMAFAGLAGNPAAGAIAAQNMDLVDVFAGVLLLAGAVMFAVAKLCIAKWNVFAKV